MSGEVAGSWVMIIAASLRVRCVLVHFRHFQRERIHPGSMSTAVLYQHWMIRDRAVKIRNRERTVVRRLGIVILEAHYPLAGSGLGCTLSQSGKNVGNRAQVAVHHA